MAVYLLKSPKYEDKSDPALQLYFTAPNSIEAFLPRESAIALHVGLVFKLQGRILIYY